MPSHDFKDIGDVLNFELLKGTITAIDSATDTCTVTVGGDTLTALLFYHCTPASELRDNGAISGAAQGFKVGDEVIVLINSDKTIIKVIGHTDGIRRCAGHGDDYYIFYKDGANLKIANCSYLENIVVKDTKTYTETFTSNTTNPISFHLKRFTHNVPATDANGNVTIETRDLYFVATSLYLNPNPYAGWTAFAAANPTFPLVANNKNTKIIMTDEVLADLNAINYNINHTCHYNTGGLSPVWHVMDSGGSGQCAEFALTKAKALLDLGYPASAIHIEGGLYSGSQIGHAWCVVQTTDGDYALDIGSDNVKTNMSMAFGTLPLYGRRRQIGSNWAFISSYGWMLASTNQASPWTLLYVLDPLLNIFYLLTPTETVTDIFSTIVNSFDVTGRSSPSVNFSEGNNSIYVADGTNIKTFKLNENQLTLVNTQPYSVVTSVNEQPYPGQGFVGRDGKIVLGVGLVGRQDYNNRGDGGGDVRISQSGSLWYITNIAPSRLGDFVCLYDCEVVSENGYFSYNYRYLTGTYSNTDTGFLIQWKDLDRPDLVNYEETAGTVVDVGQSLNACFMSKITGDLSSLLQWQLLDPFEHPPTYQNPLAGRTENYTIYGEVIPYFTEDPILLNYDARAPYPWVHIEMNESLILRGLLLNRTTDVHDNLKRMYKNGVSCLDTVAAAVGVTNANLLGLVYIPSTNRLN